MTCARSEVVREGEIGVYHCVHRCVRRAFLCGEDERTGSSFEHRRRWMQDRLQELSSVFAIDVGGFSVMSNHLHLVLRMRPDLAQTAAQAQRLVSLGAGCEGSARHVSRSDRPDRSISITFSQPARLTANRR